MSSRYRCLENDALNNFMYCYSGVPTVYDCVRGKQVHKSSRFEAIESRERIIPSAPGKFVWCVAWVLEFKVVDSMV